MEEEIKIIFENEGLLVLDKPTGKVTTSENNNGPSVETWLRENRPNGLPREGIVHRLDKGTSGMLVVAKNEQTLISLKRQFKERNVIKKYIALVGGEVVGGDIKMPIGRSRFQFSRFGVNPEGKMAITEFKVIKKIIINDKKYSLIEVNLKTGRTHQIRVHLSYLGWPLVGDRLYGGEMMLGLERPFLHAKYLKILNMEFESDMAADLKIFLKRYVDEI